MADRSTFAVVVSKSFRKRLGVDHNDLYYQHRALIHQFPIEETVGAMADWCARKVRYLRLSKRSANAGTRPSRSLLPRCKVSIRFGPAKRKFQLFHL